MDAAEIRRKQQELDFVRLRSWSYCCIAAGILNDALLLKTRRYSTVDDVILALLSSRDNTRVLTEETQNVVATS